MEDEQSYSLDNVKLMIAGLILVVVCLTIVGLIPVGILLLGLIISIKGGDVKNITATTRLIQGCMLAGALVLVGLALQQNYEANRSWVSTQSDPRSDPAYADVASLNGYQAMIDAPEVTAKWNEYNNARTSYDYARTEFMSFADRRNMLFLAAIAVAISAWFLGFLWLKPLERRFERMRQAAEDFANREWKAKKTPPPSIIKREALASYSTADELQKWRTLYQDGAISRDQYHEARDKILSRG